MPDDVLGSGPTWSASTFVAVALVALLPFLLAANHALRAPHGRCATAFRRASSLASRVRFRGRTLAESAIVVAAALAGVMLGIPLMSGLAMRQVSAAGNLVQSYREPAGPYHVTVLIDRKPIQVGMVDFGVIVERPGGEIMRDVRVVLTATPTGNLGGGESLQATAEGARSQLAYSAALQLDQPGRWRIDVRVAGPDGGAVSFDVNVAPVPLYEQPFVQAGVAGVALVPLAWWGWRRFSRHATDPADRQ